MTDSYLEKLLAELQDETIRALLEKVKDRTATAADLAVARQLLRDNAITAIPKKGSPLESLAKSLPFTGSDEDDEYVQ